VNKIFLLFLLLLSTEPLSAQIYDYSSPYVHTKSMASQNIFDRHTTKLLSAQIYNYYSPYGYTKSNVRQNIFEKHRTNFYRLYGISDINSSNDKNSQTSIWEEIGYILAMETVFTGMSYLASRKNGCGPAITGGFDLFMGLAGMKNASKQELGIQKTGHYLISAGFIAKSLYNFRFSKNHNKNNRFWINFIGFNVLVFFGYFLDTLN